MEHARYQVATATKPGLNLPQVGVPTRPLAQWTDEELLQVLEAVQDTAVLEGPDEILDEA